MAVVRVPVEGDVVVVAGAGVGEAVECEEDGAGGGSGEGSRLVEEGEEGGHGGGGDVELGGLELKEA